MNVENFIKRPTQNIENCFKLVIFLGMNDKYDPVKSKNPHCVMPMIIIDHLGTRLKAWMTQVNLRRKIRGTKKGTGCVAGQAEYPFSPS